MPQTPPAIHRARDHVDGVARLAQDISSELLQAQAVLNEQQPHGDVTFAEPFWHKRLAATIAFAPPIPPS